MAEFSMTRDSIDVTQNGLFGGSPDENRVFLPGLAHYFIDGVEVTREVFTAAYDQAYPEAHPICPRNL